LRDGIQNHGSDIESSSDSKSSIKYFLWDYADVMSYYFYTGDHLREMLDVLDKLDVDTVSGTTIDSFYNDVVDMFNNYADCYVPKRSSSFYKV
jgi:hypothetical protein